MSGLYQRALEYRRRSQLTVLRPEDVRTEQSPVEVIPPEERENVLRQIDRVIADSRSSVTPQRLAYRPRRNGTAFVFLVNACVLAIVAAGLFTAGKLLNRQEASLAREPRQMLTAESKIIAALKSESEQEMRQKDREIQDIARRLQQADAERQRLGTEIQQQLSSREQALRAEYEDALNREREALQKRGLSEEQISSQLRDLERANADALERKLAEERAALQRDFEAKASTAAALVAAYQGQLEAAQTERERLQTAAGQRLADLERQLAEREGEEARATSALTDELHRLQRQSESERMVLEQLAAAYEGASRLVQAGSYDQALESLASIRSYLDQQAVAALPIMQRRRPVELFILGSLEDLLRTRQAKASIDTASLLESANLLASVAELVRQGEERLRAKEPEEARASFEGALRTTAPGASAYARIREIDDEAAARRRAAILKLMGEGYDQYRATQYAAALGSYRSALADLLGNRNLADQVTDAVSRAGYGLLAAKQLDELSELQDQQKARQQLLSRLEQIRKRHLAEVESQAPEAMPEIDTLAALLETKVLLLRVLDREEIRAAYPDLAAAVGRYLSTYGGQRYAEGQRAALVELAGILDAIAPSAAPAAGDGRGTVLGVLDRLAMLLRGHAPPGGR